MKSVGMGKQKSSSSSRSKHYYGIGAGSKKVGATSGGGYSKGKKRDPKSYQDQLVGSYKGGKFLRSRKYSFSPHQKEKKKAGALKSGFANPLK